MSGAHGRRELRSEAGFTMVELLVAILMLATGALAILQTFDAGTRNTYRAEQTQVAVNRVQRELEAIRQLDYSQVALTSTPITSTDAEDPRHRITGTSFALNRDGTNQATMVVNGVGGVTGGAVAPGPTPFTSGDVSGTVHRFVVWQNDVACSPTACPGTQDYKRVIVAVTIDDTSIAFSRSYQEAQTDFGDPDAVATPSTAPDSQGDLLTAQQFYLSDTACSQTSRQAIDGDHDTHNTLGACSAGPSTPDGLFVGAPPDPAPADPANPALYDYANDAAVEPQPTNLDKGLQMLRQDVNGCDFGGGASPHKVHRWLSQPMPASFVLSGQATFEFYTRTIDDVNVPGEICVWLFRRHEEAGPTVTDTLLINLDSPPNPFFIYGEQPWPKLQWTRRRLVMNFSNTTVPAGDRLGLAFAVRRNGTPQNALQFIYDHPDYGSRLEVQTTTPLD